MHPDNDPSLAATAGRSVTVPANGPATGVAPHPAAGTDPTDRVKRPKIVVKFGGSNLKTAADVQRSAAIAHAYRRPLVIVVSAFFGVTDSLVAALSEAILSLDAIDDFVESLGSFHRTTLREHVRDFAACATVDAVLADRLLALDRLLRGVHYLGSAPDFVTDQVLSYGERLSAPVVTAVLRDRGLVVAEALPEAIGLVTDGAFGNATALEGRPAAEVAAALSADRCFVVPGFYGVGPDGRTTVFGRGGSDYTAAVLAAAIGAESLDLWKDVDGFLSCDPRVADDSRTIPYLSYEEAAELSYFGAKVFHPRTVEPIETRGIPIHVMNVERFHGTITPYTVVGTGMVADGPVVKSIAITDDVAVIRMEGPVVGSRPGILARATARLQSANVNISSVITAQTSINLLFKRADFGRAMAALKSEATPGVLTIVPMDDIALVAVVGQGLRDNIGLSGAIITAAAQAGVTILMAQAGAGPTAMYLVVRRGDQDDAARAIHRVCFDE